MELKDRLLGVVAERDFYRRLLDLGAANDVEPLLDEALALIRGAISRGIIGAVLVEGRTIETPAAMADARFQSRSSVRDNAIEAVPASGCRAVHARRERVERAGGPHTSVPWDGHTFRRQPRASSLHSSVSESRT